MPLQVVPRRDRKLNRLVKAAEVRALGRSEALFDAGDAARHVYLVRSGHVRLVSLRPGARRERTIAVAGPWELVGEEGVGQGVHRYRCIGGERSSYQAMDGALVLNVIKSTEQTFGALVDGWTRDLELARRLSAGSSGPSTAGRLALVLLELARRWGVPGAKGLHLSQRLTHQVLGDLAGAHRSTVTTTLNDWLYRGILGEAARGILLARPERLERLADLAGSVEGLP